MGKNDETGQETSFSQKIQKKGKVFGFQINSDFELRDFLRIILDFGRCAQFEIRRRKKLAAAHYSNHGRCMRVPTVELITNYLTVDSNH